MFISGLEELIKDILNLSPEEFQIFITNSNEIVAAIQASTKSVIIQEFFTDDALANRLVHAIYKTGNDEKHKLLSDFISFVSYWNVNEGGFKTLDLSVTVDSNLIVEYIDYLSDTLDQANFFLLSDASPYEKQLVYDNISVHSSFFFFIDFLYHSGIDTADSLVYSITLKLKDKEILPYGVRAVKLDDGCYIFERD